MFDYEKELDASWTTGRILEEVYDNLVEYVAYMYDGGTSYRLRTVMLLREFVMESMEGLEVLDRDVLVGRLRDVMRTDGWKDRVEMMVYGYFETEDYSDLIIDALAVVQAKGLVTGDLEREVLRINRAFLEIDARSKSRNRVNRDLNDLTLDVSKQVRVIVSKVLREMYIDPEVRASVAERMKNWSLRVKD